MLRGKVGWMVASALVLVLGLVAQARAQDRGDAGDRMARFREEAAKRMKESLGVTDEEWKVLQPKIEKVQTLSRQVRGGMMRGMFGRGNRPGGGNPPAPAEGTQTPVEKALADLQKVLENKDAKPEDVKPVLEAYRLARAKATEELQKAQKELKEVLTVQQEAKLVAAGVLD